MFKLVKVVRGITLTIGAQRSSLKFVSRMRDSRHHTKAFSGISVRFSHLPTSTGSIYSAEKEHIPLTHKCCNDRKCILCSILRKLRPRTIINHVNQTHGSPEQARLNKICDVSQDALAEYSKEHPDEDFISCYKDILAFACKSDYTPACLFACSSIAKCSNNEKKDLLLILLRASFSGRESFLLKGHIEKEVIIVAMEALKNGIVACSYRALHLINIILRSSSLSSQRRRDILLSIQPLLLKLDLERNVLSCGFQANLELCGLLFLLMKEAVMKKESANSFMFQTPGIYRVLTSSLMNRDLTPWDLSILLEPFTHYGVCEYNAHFLFNILGSYQTKQAESDFLFLIRKASFSGTTGLLATILNFLKEKPYLVIQEDSGKVRYIDFVLLVNILMRRISSLLVCPDECLSMDEHLFSIRELTHCLRTISKANTMIMKIRNNALSSLWHSVSVENFSTKSSPESEVTSEPRASPHLCSIMNLFQAESMRCDGTISQFSPNNTENIGVMETFHYHYFDRSSVSSFESFDSSYHYFSYVSPSHTINTLIKPILMAKSIEDIFVFLHEWEKLAESSILHTPVKPSEKLQGTACNRFGMRIDVYESIVARVMQLLAHHIPGASASLLTFDTHEYLHVLSDACKRGKFPLHKHLSVEQFSILQRFCSFSHQPLSPTLLSSKEKLPEAYKPQLLAREMKNSIPTSNLHVTCTNAGTDKSPENILKLGSVSLSDWATAFLFIVGTYNLKMRCPPQKMKVGMDFLDRLQNAMSVIAGFIGTQAISPDDKRFERILYPVADSLQKDKAYLAKCPKLPSPIGFAYAYLDEFTLWLMSTMPHLQAYLAIVQGSSLDVDKLTRLSHVVLTLLYACCCTIPTVLPLPLSLVRSISQHFFAPNQATPFFSLFLPAMRMKNLMDLARILNYLNICTPDKDRKNATAFQCVMPYSLGAYFYIATGLMDEFSEEAKRTLHFPDIAPLMQTTACFLSKNETLVTSLENPNFSNFSLDRQIMQSIKSQDNAASKILELIYRRLASKSFLRITRLSVRKLTLKQSMQLLSALLLLKPHVHNDLIASLSGRVQALSSQRLNHKVEGFESGSAEKSSSDNHTLPLESCSVDDPSCKDFVTLLENLAHAQIHDEKLLQSIIRIAPLGSMHQSILIHIFSLVLGHDSSKISEKTTGYMKRTENLVSNALESVKDDGAHTVMQIPRIAPEVQEAKPHDSLWASIGPGLGIEGLTSSLPSQLRVDLLFSLCMSLYDTLIHRDMERGTEDTSVHALHNIPLLFRQACEVGQITVADGRTLDRLMRCISVLFAILSLPTAVPGYAHHEQTVNASLDCVFDTHSGESILAQIAYRLHELALQPDFSLETLCQSCAQITKNIFVAVVTDLSSEHGTSVFSQYLQRNKSARDVLARDRRMAVRLMQFFIPRVTRSIRNANRRQVQNIIHSYALVTILQAMHGASESKTDRIYLDQLSAVPLSLLRGILRRLGVLRHELTFDDLYSFGTMFANVFHFPLPDAFLEDIASNIRMLAQLEISAVNEDKEKVNAHHMEKIAYFLHLLKRSGFDVPSALQQSFQEAWSKCTVSCK